MVRDQCWVTLFSSLPLSQELVRLQRSAGGGEDSPCLLYLMCDPDAAEEVAAVGILSSARNMEVYSCQEYCGTSRGRSVGAALNGRCVCLVLMGMFCMGDCVSQLAVRVGREMTRGPLRPWRLWEMVWSSVVAFERQRGGEL